MKLGKKGEMGMGTLIVFIALVLVAAVAASVLVTTTGSLQNKALATGKETKREVGTSINVVQIYAENGTNQNLTEFYYTMKLNSGSDSIKFEDVLFTVELNNQTADFTYNSSVNCTIGSSENHSLGATLPGGTYGIEYSMQGTNFKSGYANKGDVVKIAMPSKKIDIEALKSKAIQIRKEILEVYQTKLYG